MTQAQAPTRHRGGLLRAAVIAVIVVLVFFPGSTEVILGVAVKAAAVVAGVLVGLFLLCGGMRTRR